MTAWRDGSRETALAGFRRRGWIGFAHDDGIARWSAAVAPQALRLARDPALRAAWLRCGGTWFAGVNALENDAAGRVGDGPALAGAALDFIADAPGLGVLPLDRAQISTCWPGYPRPSALEGDAAFAYRVRRDAAHVDGLLPVGPGRRRHLGERHAWLLGLPLSGTGPGAAPFVVWEGSHEIMRAAFAAALRGTPPERWGEVDLTEACHAARRRCFETLKRVEVAASPGESYVVHRLALHGVAPWRAAADAPPRAIAYFRPEGAAATSDWLDLP